MARYMVWMNSTVGTIIEVDAESVAEAKSRAKHVLDWAEVKVVVDAGGGSDLDPDWEWLKTLRLEVDDHENIKVYNAHEIE